ncbi:MAG: methylenetetrahydrofolate--tRNA-(uracil(54)-C(5))-methyltransferase (FADH(2)-oxidizing) TrmFO [Ruminococcaceae bacterium]|jgi:methylenetetrahydrofolate--tRNA-(uracil-5-)-methyltransferase|nr:methylenetetrahydrofolate--tRNA-(uracil(54)-C(5))-methyltransferase (FADH(2)-oxidizing) TrmFO [Oscillospiraceae bacterium]
MTNTIQVYGAGLAGSEAAWQAAKQGVKVRLYEMKPGKKSPAHHSDGFAELVCSNSLRSAELTNGAGLLKEELRRMGSLIMEAALASRVAAGGALAVDREKFSAYVTEKILSCPMIEVIPEERTDLPGDEITVTATGPLTSDGLAETISALIGGKSLYFYDAAAPIVDAESVDMTKAFFASRYGKGGADYVNCPMTEPEYKAFYRALLSAEEAPLHDFEAGDALKVFEGCMPVEVMARRGEDTLRYGPMKPVGIRHPETGEEFYAVVQLRKENEAGTMYNLVGFQTHLTWPEQRRVFSMIPGLERAEFLRYGVMHRNTFLCSPDLLDADYSLRENRNLYFAGQMTGVEGYIESAASGFVAGVNAARCALGKEPFLFPEETMTGAMAHYISHGDRTLFQPMNANFGVMPPLGFRVKGGKRARNEALSQRALEAIGGIRETLGIL